MIDTETTTHHGVHEIVRLTPKKAPFRRGNVHFKTLEPVVLRIADLSGEQALRLVEEPLVDVDVSHDGGASWRRYALPPEAAPRPVTDPALSPERAIDPTGPIVPTAPIDTADGKAAPPQAADPAVPIAEPAPVDGGAPDPAAIAAAAQVDHADRGGRAVGNADRHGRSPRTPRG